MSNSKVQNYSVLLVTGNEKNVSDMSALIDSSTGTHGRYTIADVATSGSDAREKLAVTSYDIVMINAPLSDEFGHDLAFTVSEGSPSAVILFVKNEVFDDTVKYTESAGVIVISKPVNKLIFGQALRLLGAVYNKLRRYDSEMRKYEKKLNDQRLIDKAKFILIENGATEEQAHKAIEQQAMNSRMTKQEVCEMIIRKQQ